MMDTMMNCSPISPEYEARAVSIIIDTKAIEDLENIFHQECMALKNEEFGFGVWFNESRTIGVYGDDEMREMAISLYYDENAKQIEEAFHEADTLDEMINIANTIILGTIVDIISCEEETVA